MNDESNKLDMEKEWRKCEKGNVGSKKLFSIHIIILVLSFSFIMLQEKPLSE